jgi:hypothetical protein
MNPSSIINMYLIHMHLLHSLSGDDNRIGEKAMLCRPTESESESESYITTDGHSASLSWNKAPIWGSRPDFYYCQTVAGLLMWGSLSDERTGLSFTFAAGPSQHS